MYNRGPRAMLVFYRCAQYPVTRSNAADGTPQLDEGAICCLICCLIYFGVDIPSLFAMCVCMCRGACSACMYCLYTHGARGGVPVGIHSSVDAACYGSSDAFKLLHDILLLFGVLL